MRIGFLHSHFDCDDRVERQQLILMDLFDSFLPYEEELTGGPHFVLECSTFFWGLSVSMMYHVLGAQMTGALFHRHHSTFFTAYN